MQGATGIRTATRPSEAELLQRVAEGDRRALHCLYMDYFGRLGRFLTRVTTRPEVIEEVINDTMLAVWHQAGQFRGDSKPSTWIFGISYRIALKTLQRGSRTDCMALDIGPGEDLGDDTEVGDLLGRAEVEDWLAAALEQLSTEHRLAIELAYYMGMSCEEIAQVTDCPVGTVKTRIFYARRYLRKTLKELAEPAATRLGLEGKE